MRLIDADGLAEELSERVWYEREDEKQAVRIVKEFPTVDAEPVRHGQWIYNNMGGWKCSKCNNQAPFWCMATTQNLSDYCPNCGAKMDKEGIYEKVHRAKNGRTGKTGVLERKS